MSSRRAGRATAGPRSPAAPVPTPASARVAKKVITKAAAMKVPRVLPKQKAMRATTKVTKR